MLISAATIQATPDRAALRDEIREQVRTAIEQGRATAAQTVEAAQRGAEAAIQGTDAAAAAGGQQPPLPPGPPPPPDAFTGMPPAEFAPQIPQGAVIISLAFFAAIVLLILGAPLMRAFGRRFERANAVAIADPEAKQQLRELSHAVEAIAIEVERLSSGQRELSRVLAESPVHGALPDAGDRSRVRS